MGWGVVVVVVVVVGKRGGSTGERVCVCGRESESKRGSAHVEGVEAVAQGRVRVVRLAGGARGDGDHHHPLAEGRVGGRGLQHVHGPDPSQTLQQLREREKEGRERGVRVSGCLSVSLSVSLCLSVSLSPYLSLTLSPSPSLPPSLPLFFLSRSL